MSQIYFGSMGMKKYATEKTQHMTEAQMKARRLEPIFFANSGLRAPKIIQVTSLKAMKTV